MEAEKLVWGREEEALIAQGRGRLGLYEFDRATGLDRRTLMGFMDGSLVEKGDNLFLYGGHGTGKSHLVYAMAAEVAAKGKTVRVYHGESGEGLRIDIDLCRLPFMLAAETAQYPMLRPDLLTCDLLIVNEPYNSVHMDDDGCLGTILASRFKAGRSTVFTTRFTPGDLVEHNLLPLGSRYRASESTERLFLDLNIGMVARIDGRSQPIVDRSRLLDPVLFHRLRLIKLSWIKDPEILPWLKVPLPLKEWHVLYMLQESFRPIFEERRRAAVAAAQLS